MIPTPMLARCMHDVVDLRGLTADQTAEASHKIHVASLLLVGGARLLFLHATMLHPPIVAARLVPLGFDRRALHGYSGYP